MIEGPNYELWFKCVATGQPCFDKDCVKKQRCWYSSRGNDAAKHVQGTTPAADSTTTGAADLKPGWHQTLQCVVCKHDMQMCYMPRCMSNKGCAYLIGAGGNIDFGNYVMSGTATGASAVTVSDRCHYGLYKLGTIGKATVWMGRAAAVSRINEVTKKPNELIISWNGATERLGAEIDGNGKARALLPQKLFNYGTDVPYMCIDWPDYGEPPVPARWWHTLVEAIKDIDGDVSMFCYGGHGRTGTAAVLMAVIAGLVPKGEDPVRWLRKHYCQEVVESQAQIDYIEQVLDITIDAEPRHWQDYAAHVGAATSKYAYGSTVYRAGAGKTKGKAPVFDAKNPPGKKRWKKAMRKKGEHRRSPNPGEIFTLGEHAWQWSDDKQVFIYMDTARDVPIEAASALVPIKEAPK